LLKLLLPVSRFIAALVKIIQWVIKLTFGKTVRLAREGMRLSQADAALQIEKRYAEVRLSGPYLSMIETSQKTNLTIKLIYALIDFFKLAPASVALLLPDSNIAENSANYKIGDSGDEFIKIYQSLTDAEKSQAETFMKYLIAQRLPPPAK
jgi:transcriptional regulator with XRE-family HTH domain